MIVSLSMLGLGAVLGYVWGAFLTQHKLRDELCWHCGRRREGPA